MCNVDPPLKTGHVFKENTVNSEEAIKENKAGAWDRVLDTALYLPGAQVDRALFLRAALFPHFQESIIEKALANSPAEAGIPESAIRSIAQSSISFHRVGVSAISFAAGLPGGWWMAGTIPADMGQFYWHVIVISQKLAYLYGWPSLTDNSKKFDDETRMLLTLFVGVMFGAASAGKILGEIAEKIASEVVKRLPKMALTKWGVYIVAKEVAKWTGGKITKTSFARYISKGIPVISGFISGGMSWFVFTRMSKRLRIHLESLPLARQNKIQLDTTSGDSALRQQ